MKILYIAKSFHGSTTNLIARTMRDMGHTVIWLETPRSGGRSPSTAKRIMSFVKHNIPVTRNTYIKLKNRQILDTAAREKPELVLIIKGNYITADTIRVLRGMNIHCFLWFYDAIHAVYALAESPYLAFREYTRVFLKDRYLIQTLRNAGMDNLVYLPEACAPFVFHPPREHVHGGSPDNYQISMVGRHYLQREYMFRGLENYDFRIFGPSWERLLPDSPLRACWQKKSVELEDAAAVYRSSLINLNTFHFSEVASFNLRVFEITGSGGFLLSEDKDILREIFDTESDIATFRNNQELHEKIKYYLDHKKERVAMAETACGKVHEAHTYRHRIARMLEELQIL